MQITRRNFFAGAATAAAFASFPRAAHAACPFRLSVINDEISQDFDHVCYVAAHDFGLQWIELRSMWNKNVTDMPADELQRVAHHPGQIQSARHRHRQSALQDRLARRAALQSRANTAINSKPTSISSNRMRSSNTASTSAKHSRPTAFAVSISGVSKMSQALSRRHQREAAQSRTPLRRKQPHPAARKRNVLQYRTGEEAAATLGAIPEPNFMLNWDPGNSATFPGNEPYPARIFPAAQASHRPLPLQRRDPQTRRQMGVGAGGRLASLTGPAQLRALDHDGYHYAVSLETHWRGAGTPEASSRISMQGLKDALAKAGTGC